MVRLSPEVQEQLLGRPVRAVLGAADWLALARERVLITGAGGSVGSELARQIAACGPDRLVLLDHSEYALFQIERALRDRHPALQIEAVLGDVSRRADLRAACTALAPHVIYHAAAYKHVTMTERAIVPALRTNVLGTLEAARAARAAGARFVLISSDKAADPHSVMGATKRLAEVITMSLASESFRPVAVRFGNILGSSGSLVEIMARCVDEGRNIPITHPDATRFFMTAEEAVSLVLKTDLIGRHVPPHGASVHRGDPGAEVYWLDMGAPVRIGDLADRFIACATPPGQAPVGIEVMGLRPGEKMREELTTQGQVMQSTAHPSIWSARQRPVHPNVVAAAVRTVRRAVRSGAASDALAALQAVVVEFEASATAVTAARATQRAAARLRDSRFVNRDCLSIRG
ncbi:MAG TPA: polysaccharide biosynthesis protein [Vicinamibacterales bacterium]